MSKHVQQDSSPRLTGLQLNTATPPTAGQAWVATDTSGNGAWTTVSGSSDLSQATGVLQIANGGTGSSTQPFVDLSNAQTVGGVKSFTSPITVTKTYLAGPQLLAYDNGTPGAAGGGGVVSTGLTNTPTATNQRIGAIVFSVSGVQSAGIGGVATEAWAVGTSQGTELRMYVTPNGTVNRTEALHLLNDSSASFYGNAQPVTSGAQALGTTALRWANIHTNAFHMPTNAANGYVLTSDASGNGTWQAASASSGTVTSVDVSGGTTGLTTSGGPVTSSGSITLGGTLAVANGGTGSSTQNFVDLSTAQTVAGAKTFSAGATFSSGITLNATSIATDSTTGLKVGTATAAKLGFYGNTPVAQQSAGADLGTVLSTLGLRAAGTSYPLATSAAVNFGGSVRLGSTSQSSSVTLTPATMTYYQEVDATSGPITVTMGTTTTAGYSVIIKKIDSSSNQVTVSATSIDGAATYILASQNKYAHIASTTTSGTWRVWGNN